MRTRKEKHRKGQSGKTSQAVTTVEVCEHKVFYSRLIVQSSARLEKCHVHTKWNAYGLRLKSEAFAATGRSCRQTTEKLGAWESRVQSAPCKPQGASEFPTGILPCAEGAYAAHARLPI